MRESKFIILTPLQSFNYHFRCYSMLLLQLSLSFHLGSLHRHADSPHFFAFPPRFPAFPRQFSTPAFLSHASYSHPYYPHFHHFVLQCPILAFTGTMLSLYFLRIYFRKIVALVQKQTLPFFTTA